MGIHFPSDNEASRQVAYRMLQYYFTNEQFKKDFQAAQTEWASVSPKFIREHASN
jgi:acid phosphatase (class A)